MSSTIKDIAKQTGLGLATISKYLNGGNVLEKNKISIEKAIKDLDYQVNEFGRSLKTKKSMTVGVVIPELSNLFVTSIITVIEDILRQNGYSIIVCDCRSDKVRESEVMKFLSSKRVDGVIIMPSSSNGEQLNQSNVHGVPVISIDRDLDGFDADIVRADNINASKSAINHLIEMGHKNIGIIAGPQEISTSKQRLSGYKKAFNQHDMDIIESKIEFSDYTVEGGYEAMKRLYAQNKDITAVFVTNYEMTLGAIIAINEIGVKIPNELSFIGFDNLELSNVIKPKLTVVEQPIHDMGKNAADIMLKRLNGDNSNKKLLLLKTSLIKRQSVCKIN